MWVSYHLALDMRSNVCFNPGNLLAILFDLLHEALLFILHPLHMSIQLLYEPGNELGVGLHERCNVHLLVVC